MARRTRAEEVGESTRVRARAAGCRRRSSPGARRVAKVNKKVFVFLGIADGSYPLGVTVKLKDEAAHAHALTSPGAEPAGYGLGKAGWSRAGGEGVPAGAAVRLGGGELPTPGAAQRLDRGELDRAIGSP